MSGPEPGSCQTPSGRPGLGQPPGTLTAADSRTAAGPPGAGGSPFPALPAFQSGKAKRTPRLPAPLRSRPLQPGLHPAQPGVRKHYFNLLSSSNSLYVIFVAFIIIILFLKSPSLHIIIFVSPASESIRQKIVPRLGRDGKPGRLWYENISQPQSDGGWEIRRPAFVPVPGKCGRDGLGKGAVEGYL